MALIDIINAISTTLNAELAPGPAVPMTLGAEFASRFAYDEAVQSFRGPTGQMISFREVTFLDIASSNIRKRAQEGKDVHYLVTDEVRHYIVKNSLYR